jgi:hypothetical protein
MALGCEWVCARIKQKLSEIFGDEANLGLSASKLRSFLVILVIGIFPQGHLFPSMASQPHFLEAFLADIEGSVLSKSTSLPIPGAKVELPDFGLYTYTDSNGVFNFLRLILKEAIVPTRIVIEAEGFGSWTMIDVRLVADDVLFLEANLEDDPITITVPEIYADSDPGPELLNISSQNLDPILDQRDLPLPETIRIGITNNVAVCNSSADYTVEIVDFKEYVKNVLPNEWGYNWPRESYRAGAMAAKMFSWYWVAAGGRLDDADVLDSVCDQVYIPGVAYSSTNNAVDFTWNWRLTHEADGNLFRTHYMSTRYWCDYYEWLEGMCMAQWDTYYHARGENGYDLLTWDEMLYRYYWDSELSYIPHLPLAGFKLRFFGNGWGDYDRVKILLDDPQNGGLPVDVGATDMTVEWWMKTLLSENSSPACLPGGESWLDGNVILDRDIAGDGDHGEYGVSLMDGKIAFSVHNGTISDTLCGTISVADNEWHHLALTRNNSTGQMRIFVDGELDVEVIGPTGDISYRDGRTTQIPDQDPYLILGARKDDQGLAFSGWIDELRISNIIRYSDSFQRPSAPFVSDQNTMALYHFNVGYGNTIRDLSGTADGPSNGSRIYGGDPMNGPEWGVSSLFLFQKILFPIID